MSDLFVDTQRKFQLVENPVSPGSCRGCGGDKMTSGVEYFVDLGYSDEQGAVYLCNRCLKEIANLFGYYQRTNRMDNLVHDLERQVREYESKLGALRSVGLDVDLLSVALGVPPQDSGRVEQKGNKSVEPDSGGEPGDSGSTGRLKFATGD